MKGSSTVDDEPPKHVIQASGSKEKSSTGRGKNSRKFKLLVKSKYFNSFSNNYMIT